MSVVEIDIVVVGSIFTDLICYAPHLPKPGETIGGTDFQNGYGGKGANQCVAATRLGAKTAFVGKVGVDSYGKQYYDNLKSEGVNVSGIQFEEGVPSGVASIMVGSNDGQNVIITVAGANNMMTPDYVNQFENLISKSKVLICQMEIPIEATRAALQLAKKHKVYSILNVAPAGHSDLNILSLADLICVNEAEAEQVSGISPVQSAADAKLAIEKLRLLVNSSKSIIITLGSGGAVLWESGEYYQEPAPEVEVIDTTGAGDCFIGTLAYCIAKGESKHVALRKSIANASRSVGIKGTQSSFPFDVPITLV